MSAERLGWGIIGCGLFARRRLLPAFAAASNARVVALQRRNPYEAQATAREFQVPHGYGSREELLADPAVQAVFVATPNFCHQEDVLAAAAAGKHVLCEKPLGMNALQCRRMVEGCRAARVRLFTGHCFRYASAVEQAKRACNADLLDLQANETELGLLCGLRGYYSFRSPATAWRSDCRQSGGGPLLDLAPHLLDFFLYLTGDPCVEVQAYVGPERNFETGRCEDQARALLRLRGGAVAQLEVSYCEHFRNGFEVNGTTSSLRGEYTLNQIVNENVRLFQLISDPEPPRIVELPLERREVYRLEIEDVSRALLDPLHEPICATGEDGLHTLQVIDAIYAAGKSGQRVYPGLDSH